MSNLSRQNYHVDKMIRILKALPEPKENDSEQYKTHYKRIQAQVAQEMKQLDEALYKYLNRYQIKNYC